MDKRERIAAGKSVLGLELGSTRIKAVLIGEEHEILAVGCHEWENRLENGIWTYHLEDVWEGVQDAYRQLSEQVCRAYDVVISEVAAIGISAMMHGYLVFDPEGRQLAPFYTWRNTNTECAAKELTEAFQFNIPMRWGVAHLYQAILDQKEHVAELSFLTTLAGYVHWSLTGRKVLGIDDASGIFPIDSSCCDYDESMLETFDRLVESHLLKWRLRELLPEVLTAGEAAGDLTPEGALLIDPTGVLRPGIPLCPPEGDAGTGMVATNSITCLTGNVSAGTSIFAMMVLEKPLKELHREIDMVCTPTGAPVAMVHCNNGTGDLDAWIDLFGQVLEAADVRIEKKKLYHLMYHKALQGQQDCGGVLSYNYISGEPITGFEEGRPLLVRQPEARFALTNLMRSLIFSSLASLRIGMEILTEQEGVRPEKLTGHGGLFKTEQVGQQLMAAAIKVPVSVMDSAGEGGAWGIALLAAYKVWKNMGESFEQYLKDRVFANVTGVTISPDSEEEAGFEHFLKTYKKGLEIQRAAVKSLGADIGERRRI